MKTLSIALGKAMVLRMIPKIEPLSLRPQLELWEWNEDLRKSSIPPYAVKTVKLHSLARDDV